MIQFLADKTAYFLAKDDDAADIDVLSYGYYIIFQEWFVRIVALLVALPFGLFFHVLVSIVIFNVIRSSAMGVHARYPIVCKIITYIVWFGPAVLAVFFQMNFTPIIVIGLYIFGLVSLVLYAPAETNNKKVPTVQMHKRLKLESVAILSGVFMIAFLMQGILPDISFVMILTIVLACFMVHPWVYWVNGFDPVTREER